MIEPPVVSHLTTSSDQLSPSDHVLVTGPAILSSRLPTSPVSVRRRRQLLLHRTRGTRGSGERTSRRPDDSRAIRDTRAVSRLPSDDQLLRARHSLVPHLPPATTTQQCSPVPRTSTAWSTPVSSLKSQDSWCTGIPCQTWCPDPSVPMSRLSLLSCCQLLLWSPLSHPWTRRGRRVVRQRIGTS